MSAIEEIMNTIIRNFHNPASNSHIFFPTNINVQSAKWRPFCICPSVLIALQLKHTLPGTKSNQANDTLMIDGWVCIMTPTDLGLDGIHINDACVDWVVTASDSTYKKSEYCGSDSTLSYSHFNIYQTSGTALCGRNTSSQYLWWSVT